MWVAEFLQVAQALQLPYLLTLTDYWLLCWKITLINERNQICEGPRAGQACRLTCKQTFPAQRIEQRRLRAQQLLTGATHLVSPSHFLADKIKAEYPRLPIKVVPHGITFQGFTPNTRHYPNPEPLRFLFAGGLFARKGISLLLAAFRRLETADVHLQVYGSGPLQAMVQQVAQADRRITYGGVYQLAQLNELLCQVDVVVLPSIWCENLPLVMLEAQACGVPTLVAKIGGLAECVTDGVNGFTFRMGDVDDLQVKLQRIIDQPEILNPIKSNLGNPQLGQYQVATLEAEVAAYLQLYQQMAANPCAIV